MFSKKSRILVVDDIISMRKQVISALHDHGFTTFMEACDGKQAWEMILNAEAPFDVIVSDWNMPMISGFELLGMVRNHPEFKNLPFFIVTAEVSPAKIQAAFSAGCSGYVIKPVKPELLIKSFEEHLKKRAG